MGAAGYADNQPVVPNTDEKARSQNRRVEIFVLAPEAAIAGWDPLGSDSSTR
jgi:chemotaxis protein MotB